MALSVGSIASAMRACPCGGRMQRRFGRGQHRVEEQRRSHRAVRHEHRRDVDDRSRRGRRRRRSAAASAALTSRVVCVAQALRSLGRMPSSRIFVRGSRRRASATTASMPCDVVGGRPVRAAEVVGADQDHRRLRGDAVDLAMRHAPQQVRGRVAFEAEVERVPVAVEALPDRAEIPPRLGGPTRS